MLIDQVTRAKKVVALAVVVVVIVVMDMDILVWIFSLSRLASF